MQVLRKQVPLLGLATLAGLGLAARPAQAGPAPVTVANFSASNSSPDMAFNFDSTTLTLSVMPITGLPGFLNQGSLHDDGLLVFGPITETGFITTTGSGAVAATFSGGTFTFNSSKVGNPVDLTGSFSNSQLTAGALGSGSATVLSLSNVTYTGGSFLTTLPAGTILTSGSFSLALSGVTDTTVGGNGPTGLVGSNFNSFKASGAAGTFSALPGSVPEPASVIPFALGGLGLLGLIVRKTRRTSGAAA